MSPPPDAELESLARDLETLAAGGMPEVREITEAREAIRAAKGGDHDGALLLARLALDRARRAVGAAAGLRPSWRDALKPTPGLPRDGSTGTVGRSTRRDEVEFNNEIPDGHPARSAIDASIASAFAGVKGRWRVAILVSRSAPWWGLRVEGPSIYWTGTLDGPEEQSPDFVYGQVREVVRLGLLQSALPPHRGRG